MRQINSLMAMALTSLLSACSGIETRMPEVNALQEQDALAEIQSQPSNIRLNPLSSTEARQLLDSVYLRLIPAATEVCEFAKEQEECWWSVEYSDDPSLNAYAINENDVVVFHGVMEYAQTEAEVAMVVAHEIGHHIAEHIEEDERKAAAGAVISGLAVALLSASAGPCYDPSCEQSQQQAVQDMVELGATIGAHSYSVSQEEEADLFSTYILSRAGYDLVEARSMVVKMGVLSGKDSTGFFASHPAGPRRLAAFDQNVKQVLTDTDGMPDKNY